MSKDSLFLPYPVQVLTRRDQLKLKQTQDLEKKNAEKAEKPKAKGKAKGKSKAKAKSKVDGAEKPQTEVEDQDEVSPFKTPKRQLFPDDDGLNENHGDEQDPVMKVQKTLEDPTTKMVVDPQTGEQKSLAEYFEQYLPNAWKRNMKPSRDPRNGDVSADRAEEEPEKKQRRAKAKAKAGAKASPKAKAKAKGKAKAKAKALSSPSVKKEQARRRKRQGDEIMEQQPENMRDDLLLDVFREQINKMKDDKVTTDDFKTYFRDVFFKQFKSIFTFSCYWDKQAVGLVFCGGSHFAYFSFCNKRAPWKFNMTLACVSAYMMVSFKQLCIYFWFQLSTGVTACVFDVMSNLRFVDNKYNNNTTYIDITLL